MQLLYKVMVGSILALVAVGALLGGVSTFYAPALGQTSCKIHRNFIRVIPLPQGVQPDLPDICLDQVTTKRESVKQLSNSDLGQKIYKCWENVDKGSYGQEVRCYELYIESTTENIGEWRVTGYLREEGLCNQLANNQTSKGEKTECGNENQIKWEADTIKADQTVIIKYGALAGQIRVIN